MDAACVKQSLVEQIQKLSEHPELYCRSPGRDFTRKRKLSFCTLVSFILNMRGGPLTSEIIDFFSNERFIVSSSAVVQMRDKLKPEALRSLLINFNYHWLQTGRISRCRRILMMKIPSFQE